MSDDLKVKLSNLMELHEAGLLSASELAEQKRALLGAAYGTTPAAQADRGVSGATRRQAGPTGSPASPAPDPLAGATRADPGAGLPVRLGSYRVLGVVGAGGMGVVVRARHEEDGWAQQQGGDVAIKLIHPHIAADAEFRARFFAEAALGRRVHHPGLATVYDVVSEGPWLGAILEFVDGEELTARVQPGGLPPAAVLDLLRPLAEALDHLHDHGIVHRDLKPANVMVRTNGQPVLLDLGIAKHLADQGGVQTKTSTALGTSAWMAPEQADAKSVTAAADVYAFGLLAYVLLSGEMPWQEGETELRILMNKGMGRLVPLSERVSDRSGSVSAAVMAALAVDPAVRPARCGEFVEALAASVQGEAGSNSPPPAHVRREVVGSRSTPEGRQAPDAASNAPPPAHVRRETVGPRTKPSDSKTKGSPPPRPSPPSGAVGSHPLGISQLQYAQFARTVPFRQNLERFEGLCAKGTVNPLALVQLLDKPISQGGLGLTGSFATTAWVGQCTAVVFVLFASFVVALLCGAATAEATREDELGLLVMGFVFLVLPYKPIRMLCGWANREVLRTIYNELARTHRYFAEAPPYPTDRDLQRRTWAAILSQIHPSFTEPTVPLR